MRFLSLLLVGCGSLPPPGSCEVPVAGNEVVEVATVPLAPGFLDDVTFSRRLGKIIAPPEDVGQLFLIDPDSLAVDVIDVPDGVGTADATETTIYAGDRAGHLLAIDANTHAIVGRGDVQGALDYLRVSPTTDELWVSIPARSRLEIFDPVSLAPIGSVTVPGPVEGLTFGPSGRAYINTLGSIIVIDPIRRRVIGELDRGCKIPHGFPQIDEARGIAMGGCHSNGGVGVATTDGELRAGFEIGDGQAVLAYAPALHHLYLRSDPGDQLHILAVCDDGELGDLATVPLPGGGHVSTADDRGHVFTADRTTGSLVRITDPFAEVP